MLFSDNKQFWTECIELYREQRCLWDVKIQNFSNKHLRKESLDCLIEKCKDIFPNADEKFVKAKIDSLRASFRRELKKVNSSKSTGKGLDEVYEPSLWYFDMLRFTTDQETARKGVSSLSKRFYLPEEPEDNTEMTYINEIENSPSILDGDNITSPSGCSSTALTPTSELGRPVLSQTAGMTSDTSSTGPRAPQRKRKVVSEYDKKKESFLESAANALNQLNENKAFGNSIAFQLDDMDRRQKIFAQKLIPDIVFHGKLGNLNEHSAIHLKPSNCLQTNAPTFSRGEPAAHPLPGYNYGHQNYPHYQPHIPPQSSHSQAPNNPIFLSESPVTKRSQTAISTGSLNINNPTDPVEEDDNIRQYLVLSK